MSASSETIRSRRSPASAAGTRSLITARRAVRRRRSRRRGVVGAGVAASVRSAHRRRSPGGRRRPRARACSAAAARPPTVTQMSATLKIGHHCTSMKSTTPPRNQPGDRNRRSTRLPTRTADDEPDGRRVQRARRPADRDQQADDDEQGDDADHRADAGALGERHPGVERQVEAQRPDEVDVAVGEGVDRPVLRQLVDERRRRPRSSSAPRSRARTSPAGPRASIERRHRRPMPPTFSSTRTVAHGIASRRSRGIGAPDTTE